MCSSWVFKTILNSSISDRQVLRQELVLKVEPKPGLKFGLFEKVEPESWSAFLKLRVHFFSIQSHFNKNLQCVETQIIFQGFLDLFSELWKQEKKYFQWQSEQHCNHHVVSNDMRIKKVYTCSNSVWIGDDNG